MNTVTNQPNGEAPEVTGFGVGPRMLRAWQEVWNRLDRAEFRDATVLTEQVAPIAEIKPISLMSFLHRMQQTGILESEVRKVRTQVTRFYPARVEVGGVKVPVEGLTKERTFSADRKRMFVRIKCAECREYAGTGGENITCAMCGKPGSDA